VDPPECLGEHRGRRYQDGYRPARHLRAGLTASQYLFCTRSNDYANVTDQTGEADPDIEDEDDLDELLEELEELEESTLSPDQRLTLRRTRSLLGRVSRGRIFGFDDLTQQIVGGFILSGPFVVTEEVWSLAAGMNSVQWVLTVLVVFGIGYGALYQVDDDRDPDTEETVAGLPVRFVSLVSVSFLSVTILAFVFGAPETFGATGATTGKAISIGAIFSVVGAATADSLF
jgi:uncharacterized membrane protein